MIKSLWETEVAVETRNGNDQLGAPEEAGALTMSIDDFSALEERIRRAVDSVKSVRHAQAAAEERAAQFETRAAQSDARAADAEARAANAESQLHDQLPRVEQMQSELTALRAERDQVRQRVERLLAQLDALEL